MNIEELTLYQRIKHYQLDNVDARYRISQRLAKENRWSQAYTKRVIAEYKKFVFLAMVAGHVVTPSDQVDQVWHTHMLYTRSYWDDFCQGLLARPLHHEPSKGGAAEDRKHWQHYQDTLNSYERYFGHQPPADIWPDCQQRFGSDLHFVRVNRQQSWIIPKPVCSWPWPGRQMLQATTVLTLVCLLVVGGNAQALPFAVAPDSVDLFHRLVFSNLSGGSYLLFYMGLGLAMTLFALGARHSWLQQHLPTKPAAAIKLDVEQLAYLAGRQRRLVQTVVIKLYEQGHIKLDEEQKFVTVGQVEGLYTPMELEIHAAINNGHNTLTELCEVVTDVDALHEGLQKQGLLADTAYRAINASAVNRKIVCFYLPVLILGGLRVLYGASMAHPVGFLLILMLITLRLMFRLQLNFTQAETTLLGEKVLQNYKADYNSERMYNKQPSLAMAMAVAGLSVLALPAFADVGRELTGNIGNFDSNGGGGCGAGGGGGDGGGSAGCGGGGCGGCGGGCGGG
jgi:uncharacterized protein (TIGR04222 family)